MNTARPSHQILVKFFILCGLGLAIYAQTFDDPFHFDDAVTIVNNKAVHYLPDWPATFKAICEFQPSRFVTNLTFALNYYVHAFDVFGYHLINLLVHLIAACLVWWLGELLLVVQERTKDKPSNHRKNKNIPVETSPLAHVPFLAALVFLAHPVNTQAVTYISQRYESLAALFYVASVCLYIRGRMAGKKQALPFFVSATVCGLLAMFSKETAITLPLMIVFIEYFWFRREIDPKQGHGPRWGWVVALCLASLVVIPAVFRFNYTQILFAERPSQSHPGDVLTFPTYFLTQFRVLMTFARLLFVPVGLNLDYDFPMSHTLFEPETFLGFLFVVGFLVLAWRARRPYPILAFAILWFFITLSANFIPRTHVIFEHKLYLAATGAIPALSLWLFRFFKNRRALTVGFMVVIAIFSCLAFMRNKVWDTDVGLWQDVIQKSPHKARVYLGLGAAYATAGELDSALKYLTQAATMMSDPHPYNNRGMVYVRKKQDDLALEDFNKTIAINPAFVDGYVNRGELLARRKHYHEALADFNKAIEFGPGLSSAYKMRGRLYDALHRYDLAMADYNRAIAIDPGDAQATAWRGYIYALSGRSDEALRDFKAALRADPGFSDGYVFRGMYYKEHGKRDLALADINKALALKPASALAYYQRADLWAQSGNAVEAMRDVERSIALDPNYDLPYALRAFLYAQTKNYDLALKDLNKSLELNPDFIDAYLNRGLLYTVQGKEVLAVADFSKAIELNPRSPGVYNKRGSAYGHLKKYDLAIADFSKAIELNGHSAVDYYNRSMIYKEKGEFKKALADAMKAQAMGFTVSKKYLDDLKGMASR